MYDTMIIKRLKKNITNAHGKLWQFEYKRKITKIFKIRYSLFAYSSNIYETFYLKWLCCYIEKDAMKNVFKVHHPNQGVEW